MAAAETTEEVRDITGLNATQVDTIIDNLCESKEAAGWRLVDTKINTTLGSNPQQHWYGLFQKTTYLPGASGQRDDLVFRTATELTISSGAITVTQGSHTVDTEADAASDDLDDINGGSADEVIILRPASGARTVVLKHAVGANKIACPGAVPIHLAEATDYVVLCHNGSQFSVIGGSMLNTSTALTIASGAIAVTGLPEYTVDTEGAAASDDLDDITGGVAGYRLRLRLAAAARNVVIRHAIGSNKIQTPNGQNLTLDLATDVVELVSNGTQWSVVGASIVTNTGLAITDPGNAGAIPVTRSGVCALTSGGAGHTRTLAIPSFIGQTLGLIHDTDGGDVTITSAQAINQAGNTTILMTEVNDSIYLWAASIGGALRWRVGSNDGCVLGP